MMPTLMFLGVFVTGLLMPFWVFVLCVVAYALWRPGVGLIIIGVLIDAQFGVQSTSFPYVYTLTIGAVVTALELLKPHLSFYTE